MKTTWYLNGLSCANCALKIEAELQDHPSIERALVDPVQAKLVVWSEAAIEASMIEDIVHRHESHVEVRREALERESIPIPWLLLGSIALFIASFLLDGTWKTVFALGAYALGGYRVIPAAFRTLFTRDIFNENFLMTLATFGAIYLGEFAEAAAVMLFFETGEYFQDLAVERSKKSISALMDLRPDRARVERNGEIFDVEPSAVDVGETLLVAPGERVAIDSVVLEGNTTLDTSSMSGESMPVAVHEGSEVLSGSINRTHAVKLKTVKTYGDSALARVLDMVENASLKKAPTERFITRFARYYTPVVVAVALLLVLVPSVVFSQPFETWLYRALIFLVVSCPCALVVSIPLAFFAGIGSASAHGILIKSGSDLEMLASVEVVGLDKTGTLTEGRFALQEIRSEPGIDAQEMLELAAYAESLSTHPIAESLVKAYGEEIDHLRLSSMGEVSGAGVYAEVDGRNVRVGKSAFVGAEENLPGIHISVDGRYWGSFFIEDALKKSAPETVRQLKKMGKKLMLLSGDTPVHVEAVAEHLGIPSYHGGLLPDEKVHLIEDASKEQKVLFVGDGINDAPVLAAADVGVAMGGIGSDAAMEAADIVLISDEIDKLPLAFDISRRTKSILMQNIVFAIGIKLLVMGLGAAGFANMWLAVFADVGVALLAVLNSLRIFLQTPKNIKN